MLLISLSRFAVSFASILLALSSIAFSTVLSAENDNTVKTIQVSDTVYMITGRGGNIGVSIGEDGTFLVDDKYAPMTDAILKAITSIKGDTPAFVINTHWHGDHTGGNENLGRQGSVIVAHDNVRKRLSVANEIPAFNMKSEPLAKEGLPSITYGETLSFHFNKETIAINHIPNAHTDGDSVVYFKNDNILHAGDIFFNGFYPFIDVGHGGSLKGMLAAAELMLTMVDDKTKIIPGHGPLAKKADLLAYRDMLNTAYGELSKLKKQGKSLNAVLAAKPLKKLDAEWSDGIFKTDQWIGLLYKSI